MSISKKSGSKASSATKKTASKASSAVKKSGSKASSAAKKSGSKASETIKKLKDSGVAAYSGTMTCNVLNSTGGTIAVVAQHAWSNYKDTLAFIVLENGKAASFTIHVGSGGSDYWSVWIMATSGRYLYRDNKQCDVYESDLDSHNPINLNLLNQSTGFSIQMPKSSSCINNYYNTAY
jgi:hypothetical protein